MSNEASTMPPATAEPSRRLLSLDVYRGMVMLLLASNGLGVARAAQKFEGPFAGWLVFQGSHPEWISQFNFIGLSLWDLIQPAFMFIVGVSMPFSYEKRASLGESYGKRMRHAWTRAILLTLLGVFLQSLRKPETYWIFTNVLSQIGLGYGILFFFVGRSLRTQFTGGLAILIGYYLLMVLLPRDLPAYAAHFANGTSMPQQFDLWFLNLFPRAKPFEGHVYATLNFVPSIVTMLMGLMSGQVLKNKSISEATKLKQLCVAATACLLIGAVLGLTVCPVIKKLWTPSWVLFSGGWVIGLLALSYWVIDVKKWNGWVFPFVVVGLNPLAMYLLGMMGKGGVTAALKRHLPDVWFTGTHGPVVLASLTALFFWLILLWMYRRKIFLRL
ncbi:MAG: DUF5009 domain-containing protein [Verrucomicrobiales bacterium]|nr:DUF5009 domain-containing protein [Verrucomicrobiales bacterium]